MRVRVRRTYAHAVCFSESELRRKVLARLVKLVQPARPRAWRRFTSARERDTERTRLLPPAALAPRVRPLRAPAPRVRPLRAPAPRVPPCPCSRSTLRGRCRRSGAPWLRPAGRPPCGTARGRGGGTRAPPCSFLRTHARTHARTHIASRRVVGRRQQRGSLCSAQELPCAQCVLCARRPPLLLCVPKASSSSTDPPKDLPCSLSAQEPPLLLCIQRPSLSLSLSLSLSPLAPLPSPSVASPFALMSSSYASSAVVLVPAWKRSVPMELHTRPSSARSPVACACASARRHAFNSRGSMRVRSSCATAPDRGPGC